MARGWHSYDDLVITVNSGTPGAEGVDHIVIKDFISNDLVNAGTIDQIHLGKHPESEPDSPNCSRELAATTGCAVTPTATTAFPATPR